MRYLYSTRSGIWYFRYQLNHRARPLFKGLREFKRSLGKCNAAEAKIRALQLELRIRETILTSQPIDNWVDPQSSSHDKSTQSLQHNSLEEVAIKQVLNPPPKLDISSTLTSYSDEKKLIGVNNKTISSTVTRCLRVHELIEKNDVFTITRQDAQKAVTLLKQLPSNPEKSIHWDLLKNKSCLEWIELNKTLKIKPISEVTVGRYLENVSSIYKWIGLNLDDNVKNVWRGLVNKKIKGRKESEERFPFESEDLRMIFSDPVFNQLKIPIHSRNRIRHYARYWLPLILLFTGMRPNETAQLKVKNIKTKNSISYFDINNNDVDQRLKNQQSQRKVPIHSTLLKLGLLQYVQTLPTESRLFPELNFDGNYYAGSFCDWFNRHFESKLHLRDKKQSAYSFRHTFSFYFRDIEEDSIVVSDLLGQKDGSLAFDRYGKQSRLERLKEKIEKINFEDELRQVKAFELIK